MIEQLQNFDIKDIVFLVIGILGIVATVYTFRISLIQRRPYYDIISNKLFENKLKDISELKTYFNDKEINLLTSTKIAFWNGGHQIINKEDIVQRDLLCVSATKGTIILKINVEYVTNLINNVSVSKFSDTQHNIEFDYLSKNEGFILEVLHTGKSRDVFLKGTIKGSSKIQRSPINRKYKYDKYIIDPLNNFTNYILFLPGWLFVVKIPLILILFAFGITLVTPQVIILSALKLFIPKPFIFDHDFDE